MLSVRDHMTLAAEAQRWRHAGLKEAWVREHTGRSLTLHHAAVNALLDRPDAEAAYPALVRRLRRLRDARRAART